MRIWKSLLDKNYNKAAAVISFPGPTDVFRRGLCCSSSESSARKRGSDLGAGEGRAGQAAQEPPWGSPSSHLHGAELPASSGVSRGMLCPALQLYLAVPRPCQAQEFPGECSALLWSCTWLCQAVPRPCQAQGTLKQPRNN